MIDASPRQATLAASLSDLLVNHQHASAIRLPHHFIPSFFSTSAMSFVFLHIRDVYLSSSKVKSVAHPSPFLIGTDTRSIALRISPCSFALLFIISLRSIFYSSAERQWLSTPVAVRYAPPPFVHCCERILLYSITLSFRSFSMTLRAMEKSYITTSLHSTSYPFASGKAEPSVSYKAMPSLFGKAALSIVCQCEKAV